MNMNLSLATSQSFGNISCDFWSDNENNDFWMTRDQIGTALEYPEPRKAIQKIHDRHQDRMDKFSTVVSLGTVEGQRLVNREAYVYSAKGVFEICRWSRQSKADEFMDWCWEIVDGLRTGKYKLSSDSAVVPQSEFLQLVDDYTSFKEETREHILSLAYELDDAKRELLSNAKGSLSMNRVAKGLGLGRNTMMKILRQNDILFKEGNDNIPYEKFIKSGHFIVRSKPNKTGEIHSTTYVTAKGVTYIFEVMKEWNKLS